MNGSLLWRTAPSLNGMAPSLEEWLPPSINSSLTNGFLPPSLNGSLPQWTTSWGSKRLYRKGSHLYPQFPKISLNFPWISKEAAQKKEMHGSRKIKEIRGNLRKYHVITYNFHFPFFPMLKGWVAAQSAIMKLAERPLAVGASGSFLNVYRE